MIRRRLRDAAGRVASGVRGPYQDGLVPDDDLEAVREDDPYAHTIGERATAQLLNELAVDGGPAVLHELVIAAGGVVVNIDHAVVSGSTVVLIKSETWDPGFYWTLKRRTRRGLDPQPGVPAWVWRDAHTAIAAHLRRRGAVVRVHTPRVVVWSSDSDRPVRTWFVRLPGVKVFPGREVLSEVAHLTNGEPGDAVAVAALDELRVPEAALYPATTRAVGERRDRRDSRRSLPRRIRCR